MELKTFAVNGKTHHFTVKITGDFETVQVDPHISLLAEMQIKPSF
jgi:hypothetical protein